MNLLLFVLIGAFAGWLAGQVMKGHGFGLLGDIVVGVIGAFIGTYVVQAAGLGLGRGTLIGLLLAAFLGAVILLFVVRLFTSRGSGRRLWS